MSDVKTVNTSDADIVAAFAAPATNAVAAWNPQLAEIKKAPGAKEVFESSAIPGEILDLMVVSTDALKENPNLGKALAGIWYETMTLMQKDDAEGRAAREAMAKIAGTDLPGYEAQLKTTFMYYDPKAALAYLATPDALTAMDKVRQFSFANGLFGQAAKSVDDIGITFPGGRQLGNQENVKLRFDDTYTKLAAEGGL